MKAVVIGGSGFVGSHLADALLEGGHQVRVFDRRPSPYLAKGQEMFLGDILDGDQVREAVSGQDIVCNFAGIADLDEARVQALETVRQNVLGTVNLLEACRDASVRRYMHASTIYVYSNRGGFYRCSKQAAELYVEEYQKHFGLDFTIVRFGTLYGRRADRRNSIYRYLRQALSERRVRCDGTGEELREYVSVRDAARLCVQALSEEFRNEHVIITGAYPLRFRQLLELLSEILGGDIEVEFTGKENEAHYRMTPYTFEPKIGHKLTSNKYVEMGQGLLECLREIYEQIESERAETLPSKDDSH
ncbi:MAG: NAD(P)-dependent oxidoreductase [Candidatus Tectomicrobia bacterium]|uniref:NAD(P)-dependent oxidoreductase n=1 Tax=Tectimicrobiota bacterium TaxID=2528274 RepID=A0A932HV40_UNCTE|nr:NAD(P)-dependent oxidoreductase [Candidatus Tectomicrobia bacterium]